MPGPPIGVRSPDSGTGRRGEIDAIDEVRMRMPLRQLGGAIIGPEREPRTSTVLVPTSRNVVALRSMLRAARGRGQRVILDSDCNVFADGAHLIVVSPDQPPHYAPPGLRREWLQSYTAMVREADAVTVATLALAEVYREAGAREVFVIPNAVDPAQWAPPPPPREPFAVGCAGGPGHDHDLEIIRPALEWAAAQAGVEAVLFGTDAAYGFAAYSVYSRPRRTRIVNRRWPFAYRVPTFEETYAGYRERLSGLLDIGLMPLEDGGAWSDYNRGRSDLKLCEYAMAGALPIVSDAPNYDAWRDTPVLFARDADEFLEHVRWGVTHREEARERAKAVRELVLERRSIDKTAPLWRAALSGDATAAAA